MAGNLRSAAVTRALLWALPVAAGVGAALWYFGANYDWVEEKVRAGLTGEARENEYYAAQLLLQRLGFQVEKVSDMRRVLELPVPGTLFLASPQALDVDQAQRLVSWVEAGGHLIVEGTGSELNALLGVKVVGWWKQKQAHAATELRFGNRVLAIDLPYTSVLGTKRPVLADVSISGDIQWFAPPRGNENGLEEDDEEDEEQDRQRRKEPQVARPDAGFAMLHFAVGRGRVTSVGHMGVFGNYRIGEERYDHAEYWARLFTIAGDPDPIFIAPNPTFPSLMTWLVERAWPALITAGALLLAWLWRAIPRFGPIESVPPPARPGLREHLTAVGEFHLKRRDFSALLVPLREDCTRALQRHATREGVGGNPVALAQRLTGIAEAEIDRALRSSAADRAEFQRLASTLTRIRDAVNPSQRKLKTSR